MNKIESANLDIWACDYESIKLLILDKYKLAEKYNIRIPDEWPVSPEAIPVFNKIIEADQSVVGWLNYFVIHRMEKTLIGDCGFLGKPDENKTVEIGYSIIPQYRKMGFATEMVSSIINWAFSTKQVDRIIAHTVEENIPSIKVLEKLGFKLIGDKIESNEGLKCLWELKSLPD